MDLLQPFFNTISPISPQTWERFYPLFSPRELAPQEYFAREGRRAEEVAFLASGCVRAYFTNEQAKEYNKQFFIGPNMIGAYTSLLTGAPNRIAQQALTPCKVWVASYAEVEALYQDHHDLERLGRKVAERYFLEKERKELEMALLNATQRYLLFQKNFPGLDQKIQQYHIASYLGISTTQLSRLRRGLAESGNL